MKAYTITMTIWMGLTFLLCMRDLARKEYPYRKTYTKGLEVTISLVTLSMFIWGITVLLGSQ